MKQILFFLLFTSSVFSQKISYIKENEGTKYLININPETLPLNSFMTINTILGKDIVVENIKVYLTFTYLGIDNHNNIHIKAINTNKFLNSKEEFDLIFKSNNGEATINLPNGINLREIEVIPLKVKASNEKLEVKYLGSLNKHEGLKE